MRASSSYARHGKMAERIPDTNNNIDGPDKMTNSFSHVIAVNWIRMSAHKEYEISSAAAGRTIMIHVVHNDVCTAKNKNKNCVSYKFSSV